MAQKVVRIYASDYRDVLRFEDDGGSAVDILYEVIPDPTQEQSQPEPPGDARINRATSGSR